MSTGSEQQSAASTTREAQVQGVSLIDQILDTMPSTVRRPQLADMVKNLVDSIAEGTVVYDRSFANTIREAKRKLDEQLSRQLAAIMHDPKFQQLEGSWRGLNYLVMNSETCSTLKIKVLNVSKKELANDLNKAIEFDQSHAFKHIYSGEFGQAGGEPFGAIVGDYSIENNAQDLGMLGQMAQVCAAGFSPFLTAASPKLMGLDRWTDLPKPRDLESCFKGDDYVKWRSFRDHPDSRFVSLTLPRVMSRLPYGTSATSTPIDEFEFEEIVTEDARGNPIEPNHDHFAWMNAAYALAARMTDAFAKTNWCTSIRGFQNGGKVEGLPSYVATTPEGDRRQKCPTEVLIDDRRDAELGKHGLMSLVNWRSTDFAVFINGDTAHKPQKWSDKDKTANERISARLPYIMATGRLSHFFKVMGRELLGSFGEREDVEKYMRRWIAQYVLDDENPSADKKAQYPLKAAQIDVQEDEENPGVYNIVARLQPWLQIEELNASMRLVARIPQKG
jgi:type VI secretion system protein ImpC